MIIEKVISFVKENNMLCEGEHVVVGVSGGADSMCLLRVLMELSKIYLLNLTVVHIHHGIRGKEADEDKSFVESFCMKNHINFVSADFDIPAIAKKEGLSTEEAGRLKRYETFEEVLIKEHADKIAVAHNMGDNVETILLNMLRGTGISGMSGIKPVRGHIIRPIMCLTREEIEEYLRGENLGYRVDSTNLKNDYTRNKIRNELIPYLNENINSKATAHIGLLGEMVADIDDFLNEEADRQMEKLLMSGGNHHIEIDAAGFRNLHKALKTVVARKLVMKVSGKLKDITANHIKSIIDIAEGETGRKINLPYNLTAVKYPESLVIKKEVQKEEVKDLEVLIDKIPGCFDIGTSQVKFSYDKYENLNFMEKKYTKWLNCDILKGSLSIRNRREGDYIVVNESGGRKKLKDYFIDLKIPKDQREDVLLLADGSHILWVVGYRISEAAKVFDTTQNIIKVEFIQNTKESEKGYGRES